eukprot:1136557-Pelagomonas_calceolata.AAC.3
MAELTDTQQVWELLGARAKLSLTVDTSELSSRLSVDIYTFLVWFGYRHLLLQLSCPCRQLSRPSSHTTWLKVKSHSNLVTLRQLSSSEAGIAVHPLPVAAIKFSHIVKNVIKSITWAQVS